MILSMTCSTVIKLYEMETNNWKASCLVRIIRLFTANVTDVVYGHLCFRLSVFLASPSVMSVMQEISCSLREL